MPLSPLFCDPLLGHWKIQQRHLSLRVGEAGWEKGLGKPSGGCCKRASGGPKARKCPGNSPLSPHPCPPDFQNQEQLDMN